MKFGMNWWHGKTRGLFLGFLVLLAILRLYSSRPVHKAGDRVRIEFTVADTDFVRYRDIWLSDFRQEVNYGDRILAIGSLEDRVIGSKKRGFWLKPDTIQVQPGNRGLFYQINTLRHRAINRLVNYLPKPEGALAAGLFLGGTEQMSREQSEAYRRTGLTHLVVASGYNVALVVGWASAVFGRVLGRRFVLPVVLIVALVYMFAAGMTSAVVRAGLMSMLVLLGGFFGRQADARWILILTSLAMLVWNPFYLSDIGWQLSIAATAGLVFLSPRGNWWTTIAAQIATLPLILYHFGNLSLIAPLANILVLALMPLAIQITAAALIFGLVLPVAGQLVSWLAWPILKFTNTISIFLANLPLSSVTVESVSGVWVVGYYLVLVTTIYLREHGKVSN